MATRLVKIPLDKKRGMSKQVHWSDKQKYEAVVAYLALGSAFLVGEQLEIPHKTIEKWRRTDWWEKYVNQVRQSSQVKLSGKLSKIINKSSQLVEDRLENGEIRITKEGEIKRIPVNLRTANDVLAKSIDKQVMIDKIKFEEEIDRGTVLDRLKAIEERLILAAKPKQTMKIIEGEILE